MSKITHKLGLDLDIELDFKLIGINSSLRDYRLCHFINKFTGLDFIFGKEDYTDHRGNLKDKSTDEMDFHIIVERKKSEKKIIQHHFNTYRFNCQKTFEYEYYIISNKSEEGALLIPELSYFDHFFMIKHDINSEDFRQLIEQLKQVPEIIIAKEITPSSLKSKENLIL